VHVAVRATSVIVTVVAMSMSLLLRGVFRLMGVTIFMIVTGMRVPSVGIFVLGHNHFYLSVG